MLSKQFTHLGIVYTAYSELRDTDYGPEVACTITEDGSGQEVWQQQEAMSLGGQIVEFKRHLTMLMEMNDEANSPCVFCGEDHCCCEPGESATENHDRFSGHDR